MIGNYNFLLLGIMYLYCFQIDLSNKTWLQKINCKTLKIKEGPNICWDAPFFESFFFLFSFIS